MVATIRVYEYICRFNGGLAISTPYLSSLPTLLYISLIRRFGFETGRIDSTRAINVRSDLDTYQNAKINFLSLW